MATINLKKGDIFSFKEGFEKPLRILQKLYYTHNTEQYKENEEYKEARDDNIILSKIVELERETEYERKELQKKFAIFMAKSENLMERNKKFKEDYWSSIRYKIEKTKNKAEFNKVQEETDKIEEEVNKLKEEISKLEEDKKILEKEKEVRKLRRVIEERDLIQKIINFKKYKDYEFVYDGENEYINVLINVKLHDDCKDEKCLFFLPKSVLRSDIFELIQPDETQSQSEIDTEPETATNTANNIETKPDTDTKLEIPSDVNNKPQGGKRTKHRIKSYKRKSKKNRKSNKRKIKK